MTSPSSATTATEPTGEATPLESAGRLAYSGANRVLRTLAGSWQITEEAFISFCHHLDRQNFSVEAVSQNFSESGFQRVGDVAVIQLVGIMTKFGSTRDSQQVSSLSVARQVSAAAADPTIKSILLLIDSPGGQVRGTGDLARAVASARQVKDVHAYIEDCGCSAAYHVASQCTSIWCNESADVGSLGTYGVIYDFSSIFEEFGIKVHMISTGTHKGAGYPGTKITDEQLAKFQSHIDGKNALFKSAVQQGRSFSPAQVDTLFTGEVWIGSTAKAQGLVDGVASLDEVLARLHSQKGSRKMTTPAASATSNEPVAATFPELKSEFPNASSDFLVKQLEQNVTLDQARKNYFADLEAKNAELTKQLGDEQQKNKQNAVQPATPATPKAETTPTVPQGASKGNGKGSAADSDFAALYEEATEGVTDPLERRRIRAKLARQNPQAAIAINKAHAPKQVHDRIDEAYAALSR